MKMRLLLLSVILVTVSLIQVTSAKTYFVGSINEYKEKVAGCNAGDTIIWRNGNYVDVKWEIDRDSLIVMAESPGVIFSGASRIKLLADGVIISGFQFLKGAILGNVFEVTGSHNMIQDINISGYDAHYFFHVTSTARYNLVERCNFENKEMAPPGKEGSSIFQVAVDSIQPGYNVIRYCSFRNHSAPANAGGDYGMEALRIGYSYQARFISRTVVEYCLFTRCNGDGEIISNKARENVIRYNTFINNGESHLTLRHGSDNIVYGNFFIGGAGIRIKEGQNQMVYNNYFHTGDYFSIRLENYQADPLENIMITNNTFAESGSIKLGNKGDYQPENVQLVNNLFISPTGRIVEDATGKEIFEKNGVVLTKELPEATGFIKANIAVRKNSYGFFEPAELTAAEGMFSTPVNLLDVPVLDDDPRLLLDIAKNKRKRRNKFIGCYEPGKKSDPVRLYATPENTGPHYLNVLSSKINGYREYTYKQLDSVALNLYVSTPKNSADTGLYPAIVFFFGGGWNSGNITQFKPFADYFVSRGMVAILADYRVKTRHQSTPFDAVADAKSVIRFLRKHFQDLHIDTTRIVASGGSAGGHLAAATATLTGLDDETDDSQYSATPNALVLFNPVFDNGPSGYGYERIGERYREISPLHNIKPGTPPTIVFLGTNDRLIPIETAKEYKHKMEAAGNRCDLFLYEGQQHGFFNYRENSTNDNLYYRKTLMETDKFLVSLGFIRKMGNR